MIDLLFVGLMQAAAGAPATPAETPPAEQTAPATTEAAPAPAPAASTERRCRVRQVTGTRLSSVMTCRSNRQSGHQSDDTRDALHDLQRPVSPPQP